MLQRFPALRARSLAWALSGFIAMFAPARAATAGAAPADAARRWELNANVRGAAGYKENVLLSAVHPEGSAFGQLEAEIFVAPPPGAKFEALAFVSATFTRFTSAPDNPDERQAFAHLEARWLATRCLTATLATEGYYLDQVFDLSATEVERRTARLAVKGALASTTLRWEGPRAFWLELKPTAQRERYHDGSDDQRQRIGRVTLGKTFFSGRLETSFATQWLRRDYASRPQYSIAGRRLTGSELFFQQREHAARVRLAWDAAQAWTSTLSATALTNDDNGSGFFNYHQRSLRHDLTWKRAAWKVRLTGRAGRYDYDVQTQGIGINPPHRLKEEFLGQLRLERRLTPRVQLYADILWERSRSNDPLASYRVQTVVLGLDWSLR